MAEPPFFVTGTIMTVPIAGGDPTSIIGSEAFPQRLAADATHVYWTDQTSGLPATGSVKMMPLPGGTVTTLADAIGVNGLAVDAARVCWGLCGTANAVMSAPIGGGTPTTVVAVDETAGCVNEVTVDARDVYWTTTIGYGMGEVLSSLFRAPLAGGPFVKIAGEFGAPGGIAAIPLPFRVGTTATSVYWTGEADPSEGRGVCRVSVDGTGETTLAVTTGAPARVAVDDRSVYWTEASTYVSGPGGKKALVPGTVMKLTPR